MDNIQKLREKVEKDPKSTVFVRLADELKKAGQLDEAVEVLKTGIENQPGYMSARVALGKIYLDKKMTDEAKAEFMQVVEAVPDNLFARKKLAELYRTEGDTDLAIEHYRKYLSMSPQDEEVQAICRELESGPAPEAKAREGKPAKEGPVDPSKRPSPLRAGLEQEGQPPQPAPRQAAPASNSRPSPKQATEEAEINAEDVYLESSPYEEEETEGFLSSLSDKDADADGGAQDEFSLSLQEKRGDASGKGVEFKGFDLENGGTLEMMGQNDIDSMIEEVAGVPDEPAVEHQPESGSPADEGPAGAGPGATFDTAAAGEEDVSEQAGVVEFGEADADMGLELEGVHTGEEEETGFGIVEISEEDTGVELEGFMETGSEGLVESAEAATSFAPPAGEPEPQPQAPAPGLEEQLAEADTLVENEEYGKALEVYRRLLAIDGGNTEARQRAEELRGLVKLLGKDREITEARLQSFLGALQRKKHEFFGSS